MADVTAAARLVGYAIDHRQRPSEGSEYQELLAAYSTDAAFSELTRKICSGLGLFPAGVTRRGLILTALDDSPFAVTLAELTTDGVTDRLLHGLVVLAIAAYGYPDADALEASTTPTVRISDIERLLDTQAAHIVELNSEDPDVDPQASTAAGEWLRRNAIAETDKTGRPKRGCRRWYVLKTFEILATHGLARPESALGDDVYQLTDRFRLTISTTAASAAYAHLAAAAQRDGGPVAEETH